MTRSILWQSLLILGAFVAVSALTMIWGPLAAQKTLFFRPLAASDLASVRYFWDVRHYADLVITPRCWAFYPAWPTLIRVLFDPQSPVDAAIAMVRLSQGLFVLGLPLLLWAFRRVVKDARLAFLAVMLFTVGPLGVFRVIGYTEALFAIEAATLILLMQSWQSRARGWWWLPSIAVTCFLLSLTRPVLVQLTAAVVWTLLVLVVIRLRSGQTQTLRAAVQLEDRAFVLAAVMVIAAALGYAVYGAFCYAETGDFLLPFSAQSAWGKKLGFNLINLIVQNATHKDFLGLYFPLILSAIALKMVFDVQPPDPQRRRLGMLPLRFSLPLAILPVVWLAAHLIWFAVQLSVPRLQSPVQPERATPRVWAGSFVFWFALFMALSHSILLLLVADDLQSLARFVFGQPFFFLALGVLARELKPQRIWPSFLFLQGVSLVLIVENWLNFARNTWMG